MINLHDKIALITGGSRGIGSAISLLLSRAGANVSITYQSDFLSAKMTRDRILQYGQDCLAIRADVSHPRDVHRVIKETMKRFGRIDILVNNAGVWKKGEIGNMTERQWDETLDINLKGTFLFCNAVAPLMKRNGWGRIVNIASTAGQRGEAFYSHYAASKAGMIAFTKSIAVELAPFHINVNCVAPGWVDTDMTAGALRASNKKKINAGIPRGKVASPEDIAGSVLFLTSDFANHLIGTTISVNGGGVLI